MVKEIEDILYEFIRMKPKKINKKIKIKKFEEEINKVIK